MGSVSELVVELEKRQPCDDADRFSLFPIRDEESWKRYKTLEAMTWTANELDFGRDINDYETKISPEARDLLDLVLAFFSAADGIVIDNIVLRFLRELPTLEARSFLICQMQNELVHAETYSLTINTLVRDPDKRERLFRAVVDMPCVKKKSDLMLKYMRAELPLPSRQLAFACAEGILFMAAFLYIFYFRHLGVMQTVVFSNELISRDEGMHRDQGIGVYIRLGRIAEEEAQAIVRAFVDLECEFAAEALPKDLPGLRVSDAQNYVRLLGDHLLFSAGHARVWNVDVTTLPSWMNDLCMGQKSNFYEVGVGNYKVTKLSAAIDWRKRINGASSDDLFQDPQNVDF